MTEQLTVTIITLLPLVFRKKTKAKNYRLNTFLPMILSSTISFFWPNSFKDSTKGSREWEEGTAESPQELFRVMNTFLTAEGGWPCGVCVWTLSTIHSKCRLLHANYTSKSHFRIRGHTRQRLCPPLHPLSHVARLQSPCRESGESRGSDGEPLLLSHWTPTPEPRFLNRKSGHCDVVSLRLQNQL